VCAGIDGLSSRRASGAGRSEGRVRVLASGVEYTDAVSRFHLYAQTMCRQLPFVLGYDVVVENPHRESRGVALVELDGKPLNARDHTPLVKDSEHHLCIELG
jgi:hypothetical protein